MSEDQTTTEPPAALPLLTAEQILAAADLPYCDFPVPEWGGTVRIATLSSADDDDWFDIEEKMKAAHGGKLPGRGRWESFIAFCLRKADGVTPMFSQADVERLARKSPRALRRVYRACVAWNKLDAAAVETAAKNSDRDSGGPSSSASVAISVSPTPVTLTASA